MYVFRSVHYACFICRKNFRFRPNQLSQDYTPTCPECHSIMFNMGPNFKAPKSNATKQWSIIETSRRQGIYRCYTKPVGQQMLEELPLTRSKIKGRAI
jgi:hypothetical protein